MADVAQAIRHVFQSAIATNGNGTAMAVGGLPGVGVQITGLTTATVNWEATIDGTNWVAVQASNLNNGAVAATATANGLYYVPTPGVDQIRARISGHSSGTITITGKGTFNPAGMNLSDIDVQSTETVTANQGTAGANAWPVKISQTTTDNDVDINSFPAGNLGQRAMAASLSVVPASNITAGTYVGNVQLNASTQNIGNVDIISLPSGNLGQQVSTAGLCVTPATDIVDATYIGDIKFGESLPSGTATIGAVIGPLTSTAAAISGQITVTTAGTAVQGPSVALTNGVFIRALTANTGNVYVGNNGAGDVTTSGGYELDAGDIIVTQVPNLNYLWFDASANAQKVCWIVG